MNREPWLERLQGLAGRFSALGVAADMGAMGQCELWGLYLFLCRLGGEA